MQLSQLADTAGIISARLLRLDFAGIRRLMRVNRLFHPEEIVQNFSHMDKLAETIALPSASPRPSPLPLALRAIPETYEYLGQTHRLADHKTDRNVTAFLVIKGGAVLHEDYRLGTAQDSLRISWSMSKSVTSLLLGALIDHGLIPETALAEGVSDHIPTLKGSGYDGVTLQNVLNMASGVAFNEDYLDYHSDINRMGRILGVGGSMDAFAASLSRQWAPGTYNNYVSIDTHIIGMMIRALTGRAITPLLMEHLLTPLGLESDSTILTDSLGEPFVLGGLNMTTRDYARIALMVLNRGRWNGKQIVSEGWIDRTTCQSAPPPSPQMAARTDGALGYGMQWWLPPEPEEGEVFGVGIYGQYMYIHRAHDVVIAQNAADTRFKEGDGAVNLQTLAMFRQIAKAL
ncbi:serine hydrolase [Alphaproteobacteria bacterium KMM 3653]|uniref:Serine hydrolase n=1 Tax=Harenicola maris TaxID=2841044 RepID=A0AAP2G6P1_9RHOB|nr:serine hydrolase [Harenicola maris]